MTSYERRYTLRAQAIDEMLIDVEVFRDRVSSACAAFKPSDRHVVARAEEYSVDGASLLDKFHDTILPTLRRMAIRTKSKQLRSVLADSYLLKDTEVSLVTQALLEKRTSNIISDFIDAITDSPPSSRGTKIRDSAQTLLSQKSAAELADLYTAYLEYEIYTDVARHCLVSFVDPHLSSREQRQARKRIKREQTLYAESFKDRRWNVEYRLEQLSRTYDGLVDVIVENGWKIETLTSISQKYDALTIEDTKNNRHNSEWALHFTEATHSFTSSELRGRVGKNEPSLQVAIGARHEVETHLAHLLNLSRVQLENLPRCVEEFIRLLTEQSKYTKRR